MRRLLAIFAVWLGCGLAWMILGSTLLLRSGESSSRLGDEVHELWGPPMKQLPPRAFSRPAQPTPAPAVAPAAQPLPLDRDDRATEVPPAPAPAAALDPAPLVGSDLDVGLALEHRKKGLVWFPTYALSFRGRYTFHNTQKEKRALSFELPLENQNALYDGFEVTRDGGVVASEVEQGTARWSDELAPNEKRTYEVVYRSRGTTSWQYDLTNGTDKVRDFKLALKTSFEDVNFSPGSLSPTEHAATNGGWQGTWSFKTLVSSSSIGVDLPQKLNPGPLASRITFFAPVSLLFFFFVVAILSQARDKKLHPLHFFFFGCAFFAFHLLFSYLVDHLAIAPSFAIASVVSIALVVSYARLFVGWRFALREMGLSQLIYLVLFSFSFFFSGFTGLSITVGAILTLFVVMQIVGKKDVSELESGEPKPVCASPYRCAVGEAQR